MSAEVKYRTKVIESAAQDFPKEMEAQVTEQLIAALAECGADVSTNDPKVFQRSLKNNNIHWESLYYPLTPEKSGLYFYKNNILVKFVFIPRTEGIDMTNLMGELL